MRADIRAFLKKILSRLTFVNSLRFRIFAIVIIVSYVPTLIMRYGILQNYEERAVSLRISEVENQAMILANHLGANNYLQDTSLETINAELIQLSNLYDGRVLVIDQNFNVVRDTYGISEGKTIISEEVIRCFKGNNVSNYDVNNRFIEMTTPITVTLNNGEKGGNTSEGKDKSKIVGVMLISVSTDNITTNIAVLDGKASILQFLMMVLVVALSWITSRILVKPFEQVTAAIRAVKDGFEAEAIDVSDYLETEHIITAFNELLNRMKALDESRQEFVSNVSHELKTPMTSMKVLADSLVGQTGVPEELYQEFMSDITAEIDRENKIITDLLSLVKMDKKAADLNIAHMDINKLLEDILKRLRPIADKRSIDLILDSFRPVEADVDEVKFTLAISNLVENGIKYNVDEGWVRVSLDADHKYFYVTVADSGMGIPQDSVDKIFERFYRVDKSHSKEIGGTGLGLAITRSSIVMHHGAIKVFSKEGEGTTFSVRIPLSYIP